MDSFPDLKTLAVMFTAVTRKNLDIVDRLLSALINHPTAAEFHVNISDGTGIYEVISLISRYCCREVMELVQSEECNYFSPPKPLSQLSQKHFSNF